MCPLLVRFGGTLAREPAASRVHHAGYRICLRKLVAYGGNHRVGRSVHILLIGGSKGKRRHEQVRSRNSYQEKALQGITLTLIVWLMKLDRPELNQSSMTAFSYKRQMTFLFRFA